MLGVFAHFSRLSGTSHGIRQWNSHFFHRLCQIWQPNQDPLAEGQIRHAILLIRDCFRFLIYMLFKNEVTERAKVPSCAPKPSVSRLFSTTTSSREPPTFPLVINVSPSRFKKWTLIFWAAPCPCQHAQCPDCHCPDPPQCSLLAWVPRGLWRGAATHGPQRKCAEAGRRRLHSSCSEKFPVAGGEPEPGPPWGARGLGCRSSPTPCHVLRP